MEKWTIKQIVLLAFVAFLFGGVFMGAGFLYVLLEAALLPIGLSPFANELLFGLWTMAAPIAGMLIPKAGSAVLGELFAALAEMLYGSYFGPGVLISGLLQGLGTEAGFFVTKYQRYDSVALLYGAIGTTVFSFIYEFFKFGYGAYGFWLVVALFLVRLASVSFFGVFVVQQIMKLYRKAQDTSMAVK